MKKVLSFLLLISSLFLLLGCDLLFPVSETKDKISSSTEQIDYRITTKNPNILVSMGEKVSLDYTINFKVQEGEHLDFVSSDPNVVRVSSDGRLIPKGKGKCTVTVSYRTAILTYQVEVNQKIEFVAPTKINYDIGEEIDLSGSEIVYYLDEYVVDKVVTVTADMITGFDTLSSGEKEVTVTYGNESFNFFITVQNKEFGPYLIETLSFPKTITANEKMEVKVNHQDISLLKSTLESVYDYSEYKIVLIVTSPSLKQERMNAFLFQDYSETRTNKTLNTNSNLEGNVNVKEGYNFKITLAKKDDSFYMIRYTPSEIGEYQYEAVVYIKNGFVVQRLEGTFNVSSMKTTKGPIRVSNNNRTFEFENGNTYLAVGENVAWYTSSERRYGDYEMWFDGLSQNNANYARIWLAAWGFSLFWKDVKNYDSKLDEAYELDKVFELAEASGIYINLTFFHHGMFSKEVNPMWPGSSNTWYTGKYGANPFGNILSSPGEFFTDSTAKLWTKNYLAYISARYGYSDNLMSYELFNEVDWVEEYNSEIGNLWHDEMAKYLKNNNYKNHLVTTSVKGDSFGNSTYSVFNLESIDYVNVHNYGTKNYLNYIPGKVMDAYSRFDKPIMYQEVGYGGNSGQDQLSKDPNDITLHQELWAGLMSSGAGGMNWWWDSWIEPNNSYSKFEAPGLYAKLVDLSGEMTLAYQSNKVTQSQNKIVTLGYLFSTKAYLYVHSRDYSVDNTSVSINSTMKVSGLTSGTYPVKTFDTNTGEITKTEEKTTSNGEISISVITTNDVAFIITKK